MALTQQRPVALVTGASSGIGRACALTLARRGYAVVVHYGENRDAAEETARDIRAGGGIGAIMQQRLEGLADGADFWGKARDALAQVGAEQVDLLVLSAGIDDRAPFPDVPAERIRRVFDVNAVSPMLIIQHAPTWVAEGGAVVLVSSIAATDPIPDSLPYSASKAALNNLVTGAASWLWPHGIRVNAVAPGAVDTPMQEAERLARMKQRGLVGEPGQIAEVVSFLGSRASQWVTGQTIRAAGPLI